MVNYRITVSNTVTGSYYTLTQNYFALDAREARMHLEMLHDEFQSGMWTGFLERSGLLQTGQAARDVLPDLLIGAVVERTCIATRWLCPKKQEKHELDSRKDKALPD